MKKIILSMVFVFAIATSNYSSTGIIQLDSKQNVLKVEGKASDCVKQAREIVIEISDITGHNPNNYMDLYMELYLHCYYN